MNEQFADVCDCCGASAPVVVHKMAEGVKPPPSIRRLCQLCEATRIGRLHLMGQDDTDAARIMQVVCYVGNQILARLDERPSYPD